MALRVDDCRTLSFLTYSRGHRIDLPPAIVIFRNMTGVNERILAVIRGFLELSPDEQGQAMEILSEYYIADASARESFVSAAREFASDAPNGRGDLPRADVAPRHHKIY